VDTLTHGLSGALLARATWSDRDADRGVGAAERAAVGFAAASFPDIDYLLFWVDPLVYLNLHQGWTHSFVLMPGWAGLLSPLLARIGAYWTGQPRAWRDYYTVCLLGIGVHIGGDVLTAYGTQIWAPLSGSRFAWPISFVIDPYFSAILVTGLCWALRSRQVLPPRLALLALGTYILMQALCWYQAFAVAQGYAKRRGVTQAEIQVLAQPFSPFNWKLLVVDQEGIDEAHVRLLRTDPLALFNPGRCVFPETATAYAPIDRARWSRHPRFGADPVTTISAREAWSAEGFDGFRRFAVFPFLYRVDHDSRGRCVWFTDLRYTLPAMLPAFRFGMCRETPESPWRLYRIRLFTEDERQPLRH
jgi:inner membrane protein